MMSIVGPIMFVLGLISLAAGGYVCRDAAETYKHASEKYREAVTLADEAKRLVSE